MIGKSHLGEVLNRILSIDLVMPHTMQLQLQGLFWTEGIWFMQVFGKSFLLFLFSGVASLRLTSLRQKA